MKLPKKIILIAFSAIFLSCLSNLDFEQVKEIETTPVFNISLGFFNISSDGFASNNSAPITSISEDIEYRIFENQILRDNLIRQEYNINVVNTFNRSFILSVSFLDENGTDTFTSVSYTIAANDTDFKEKVIINDIATSNSVVKNTTILRLKLSLEDESNPISATSAGTFNFKSSTTVYLGTSINNEE